MWAVSELRWVLAMHGRHGIALVVRYRRGVRGRPPSAAVAARGGRAHPHRGHPVGARGRHAGCRCCSPFHCCRYAIAVAILRHGLLDIRLVLARGLSYAVLSAFVLAGYVLLVLALSDMASALLVALLAFPLRVWVQRGVERLLYGERDPLRVASRVGDRLGDLDASLAEIRSAMRLPYVAVVVDAVVAESGTDAGAHRAPPARAQRRAGGRAAARRERPVGATTNGCSTCSPARSRWRCTPPPPRRRPADVARAPGGRAGGGAAAAAPGPARRARARCSPASRWPPTPRRTCSAATRSKAARPARHRPRRDPDRDRRSAPRRRRSPAAGARRARASPARWRRRAARTVRRADGGPLRVTVDADSVCQLPAAIEVAAYRIATEALNNVVRHSNASSVSLRVSQGGRARRGGARRRGARRRMGPRRGAEARCASGRPNWVASARPGRPRPGARSGPDCPWSFT